MAAHVTEWHRDTWRHMSLSGTVTRGGTRYYVSGTVHVAAHVTEWRRTSRMIVMSDGANNTSRHMDLATLHATAELNVIAGHYDTSRT